MNGADRETEAMVPETERGDLQTGDAQELSYEELQGLGVMGVDSGFDRKLADWIAKANFEHLTVTVTLYKFDNADGGDAKQQCGQWENNIPDPHQIGLTYGAGRYLILTTFPRGQKQQRGIKGYRIRLHPHYDKLQQEHAAKAAGFGPGGYPPMMHHVVPPSKNPMTEGLDAVAKLVGIIAPLLIQKNSGGGDIGAFMLNSYKSMSQLLKESTMENIRNMNEAARLALADKAEEGENLSGATEEPNTLERLAPLLAEYVPILLGQGKGATATVTALKQLPQYKKLLRNKSELDKVIDHLDKTLGTAKTDRLLAKLKVTRPRKQIAVPQAAAAAAAATA